MCDMPIKFTQKTPPPQPQPPTTYGVEGLDKQEMRWMLELLQEGRKHIGVNNGPPFFTSEKQDFGRRVTAVIAAKVDVLA